MPSRRKKLTQREEKALLLYIINGYKNIQNCCIQAGFPEKSAGLQGSKLLQHELAQTFIQERSKKALEKYSKNADNVLNELVLMAFSDIGNYFYRDDNGSVIMKDILQMGAERRAIKKIKHKQHIVKMEDGQEVVTNEYEYELWDKKGSLELLGKYHKLFVDSLQPQQDGNAKGPVVYLPDNGKGGKAIVAVEWENK